MKTFKVLLLNGSRNQTGNTNEALKLACLALNELGCETEVFWIGSEHIESCRFCGKCKPGGKCVIDDTVNAFLEKAGEADGFIFAAPLARLEKGGSIDSLLERCFTAGGERMMRKPAATLTVARRSGDKSLHHRMNGKFTGARIPLIASIFWNLSHTGKDHDEIHRDRIGIKKICAIATDMVYYLRCFEAAGEAGIEPPCGDVEITVDTDE